MTSNTQLGRGVLRINGQEVGNCSTVDLSTNDENRTRLHVVCDNVTKENFERFHKASGPFEISFTQTPVLTGSRHFRLTAQGERDHARFGFISEEWAAFTVIYLLDDFDIDLIQS